MGSVVEGQHHVLLADLQLASDVEQILGYGAGRARPRRRAPPKPTRLRIGSRGGWSPRYLEDEHGRFGCVAPHADGWTLAQFGGCRRKTESWARAGRALPAMGALSSTITPNFRISGGVEDREDLDDFFFRFVDHDEGKATHLSLPVAQENNGRGFRVGLDELENLLQSRLESIAKANLGLLIPRKSGSDLPSCCGRKAQLHAVASRSTSLQNSSSDKAS